MPMISLQKAKKEGLHGVSLPKVAMLMLFHSYVASLEARIEKLEKRLLYAQQRRTSLSMHDEPSLESPDRKDSLATIRAAVQDTAAKRRETTDVNELVSDFGFL